MEFDFNDIETVVPSGAATDNAQARVSRVVDTLGQAQARKAELEAQLSKVEAEIRHLEEVTLPTMLAEMGFNSVETSNGNRVVMKDDVHASLPKEDLARRHAALRWLAENDQGACIKTVTTVEFSKGDADTAKAFSAHVESFDRRGLVAVKTTEDVHPSTLKALIVRGYRDGSMPMEVVQLLGGHVRRVAKVEKPKK